MRLAIARLREYGASNFYEAEIQLRWFRLFGLFWVIHGSVRGSPYFAIQTKDPEYRDIQREVWGG